MKVALFLGAGFSVPFGLPAMNGFLEFADRCQRLSDDDRTLIAKLVLEARGANSFLESSPTNLEDILSFSEMGERLELSPHAGRAQHLRDVIRKVYTTAPSPKEYWVRYKPLERLLGARKFRSIAQSLSLITTNYDLNAESACNALQVPVKLPFELVRRDNPGTIRLGTLYSDQGIDLFKLHGSVNWYAGGNGEVIVDDQIVEMQNWDHDGRLSLPYPCAQDYPNQGSPLIIPPSFLKPELPRALKAVWAGAAKALSQANIVAFVGYSFPHSDTEMMYFLARAFSENAVIRNIYLVDPRADEIVARLRHSSSKLGSHFRELLTPINSDWIGQALPIDWRGVES